MFLHPSSGAQLQRTAMGVCMVLVCYCIGTGTGWDTFTLKHGQFQTMPKCKGVYSLEEYFNFNWKMNVALS
jgi:hypothetical protein